MQTLESLKAKGQASFASLREMVNERPADVKIWGVTAGSAVVGAVAVNTAARGVVAILAALAAPPLALTIGAVGGGYLGWNYIHSRQAGEQDVLETSPEPVVEAIEVIAVETPVVVEVVEVAEVPTVEEDDLQKINGIGPVYAGLLQAAGIHTFAQLAELSAEQIRAIIEAERSGHMIEPEVWLAEARQFMAADR